MKLYSRIAIVILVISITASCGRDHQKEQVHEASQESHWSYEGETSPEHWAELEKNSDCSGQRQSPVNIIDIKTVEDDRSGKYNRIVLFT